MLKIEINRQALLRSLQLHLKSSASRTDLPLLTCVLITTNPQDSKITIKSTDLNQALIEDFNTKIHSEGIIAVPIKIVTEFISSLSDETITIEELPNLRLSIKSKNHSSIVHILDPADYPEIPIISTNKSVPIQKEALKEALDKTIFSASKDTSRPVLCGIYIWGDESTFNLVSTDGFRLTEYPITLSSALDQPLSLILPTVAAAELQKVLQHSPDNQPLQIYPEGDQISFRAGGITLISRTVSGDYPDYQNIIPTSSEITLSVDRMELLQSVKIASIFAKESAGTISLQVDQQDQILTINSVANQIGENHSQIAISTNESGNINLNSRYLIDALNSFDSDLLELSFSKGLAPIIIKPSTSSPTNSKQQLHIIMPVNN
jgi:DNA polymerase-3 subunit beta